MPTTWIESKRRCGMVEHGHQPPHAVQAEAHPEQLAARAGGARPPPRVQSTARGRPHSASSSAREPLQLLALGRDHLRRRLRDEAVVGELALCARRSPLERRALRGAPALGGAEVDIRAAELDRPARDGDARDRLAAVAGSRATAARAARLLAPCRRSPSAASRAASVAPAVTSAAVAPAAHAPVTASIARPSAASASRSSRPSLGPVPAASRPSRPGDVRLDLLGDERDHRVGERQRPAQHVQQRRSARSRLPDAQARLDQLEVPVAQLAVDEVVQRRAPRGRSRRPRSAPRSRASARARRERIQRSSTRGRPSRAGTRVGPRRRSRISRAAFHSLFASAAPARPFLGEAHVLGRGHRQQAEAHGVGAVRSISSERVDARCPATSTSAARRAPGSPSARRRPRTGSRPVNSRPIMIIRATHRKMMSRAVTSTSVG